MTGDNENGQNETVENGGTDNNYLETIKELKENTVPKEIYEKVVKENKKLLDDYLNNNNVSDENEIVDYQAQLEETSKKLFDSTECEKLSNREYIENALKFREASIIVKGIDPFLPNGNSDFIETEEDAQKIAEGLQAMVDTANGDDNAFNVIYQQNVVDLKSQQMQPKTVKKIKIGGR